ncbi:hypothetical protein [Frankia sp. CiP3]|uniref:hypothetical protein n=1 Tax=Frankia sp. CiP3 TaxID=2880971 RepID=UPI001EF4A227|nr:hypothetical protein [Frankia sp. CiP3]
MTRFADRDGGTGGRHRSPWGRSGRILPIRWGRIVAAATALLIVVGVGAWLRFRPAGAQAVPPHEPAAVAVTGASGAVARGVTTPPTPVDTGRGSVNEATAGGAPSPTGRSTMPLPVVAADGGARIISPTATAASVASLVFAPGTVGFGSVNSSATVELRNTGTTAVDYRFAAAPAWLTIAPSAGAVAAGGRATTVFSLDRAAAPVGTVDIAVAVAARGGGAAADSRGAIRVTATVSGPPAIDSVAAVPSIVYPLGCASASSPAQSTVSVRATDSTGVFGVRLVARLPDGRTTTTSLDLDSATGQQSAWSGPVGPSTTAGPLSFTVTVTDLNGLHADSTGSLDVRECPAPAG